MSFWTKYPPPSSSSPTPALAARPPIWKWHTPGEVLEGLIVALEDVRFDGTSKPSTPVLTIARTEAGDTWRLPLNRSTLFDRVRELEPEAGDLIRITYTARGERALLFSAEVLVRSDELAELEDQGDNLETSKPRNALPPLAVVDDRPRITPGEVKQRILTRTRELGWLGESAIGEARRIYELNDPAQMTEENLDYLLARMIGPDL